MDGNKTYTIEIEKNNGEIISFENIKDVFLNDENSTILDVENDDGEIVFSALSEDCKEVFIVDDCPTCDGTGRTDKQVTEDYFIEGFYECPDCKGVGIIKIRW